MEVLHRSYLHACTFAVQAVQTVELTLAPLNNIPLHLVAIVGANVRINVSIAYVLTYIQYSLHIEGSIGR